MGRWGGGEEKACEFRTAPAGSAGDVEKSRVSRSGEGGETPPPRNMHKSRFGRSRGLHPQGFRHMSQQCGHSRKWATSRTMGHGPGGDAKSSVRHVCLATQSCPTQRDPMDCSPPGSSVLGISQARTPDWVCHFLLQGISPTQGCNPRLLHRRASSLPTALPGNPSHSSM